ncbi:nuclear transport factor 2 family protein [Zhouia amylolytica]|uniref:nuclear transport factor 2 family protein n=1 Tax=Zhouia amylolytica TaxID=376730 RepID=UPI0020CC611A|nr:nuclear transport factor 2 family protein [Zhouia amylolytica]MCQ0112442.1 nuclear transport factor 2 family protein [Zhouia amylolytica]
MLRFILLVLLFLTQMVFGQRSTDEAAVKETIDEFFTGFHQQDSIQIKATVFNPVMQTIGKSKEGLTLVRTETFSNFLKSIVSIPEDKVYQEKLLGYEIKIDGDMAHAWTPYEFWLNDKFSHCGVNSFQLVRKDDDWKIIYIVDTRRREGCQ